MQLPKDFIDSTLTTMGEELFSKFISALDDESPASIRVNVAKTALSCRGTAVPWCQSGFYLEGRPPFTFDPLFHAGAYYVQEAASMFVDYVMRKAVTDNIDKPLLVLDLCAAPGGKSTALRAALPEGSLLFSNEPDRRRCNILSENIMKWGHPDVVVTNNYPRDYRKSGIAFDAILCDVPCSGEGMFRKDEGAIREWSVQNVERCQRLQREIVSEAWSCLRDGGMMIYSTCTLNTKENEENVKWICCELGAEIVALDVPCEWNITGSLLSGFDAPVYRFIPGITRSEGLFMAVLHKSGEGMATVVNDALHSMAAKRLNVVLDGVMSPTVKGRDFIPAHGEALSLSLERTKYPSVELEYPTAIQYLRKEAITVPADTPRGIVVVTFLGFPLGFAKNIGNRANNLYPQEWKIKSTHIPKEYETILEFT